MFTTVMHAYLTCLSVGATLYVYSLIYLFDIDVDQLRYYYNEPSRNISSYLACICVLEYLGYFAPD